MKKAMLRALISIVCLAVPLLASGEYSPYLQSDYPQNVYFGETHLHTPFSFDAGMVGDKLGTDEAYRFAKGEVVTASLGARAKLGRPLDFLVIADHAGSLGIAPLIAESSPFEYTSPSCPLIHMM